jgi:UDP-N-acetylmuramate--alanine ligase
MASFLNYWPKMIVFTRLEADHLDYYKNLDNVFKAFKEFISRLPNGGALAANRDDENIQKLLNQKSEARNSKRTLKPKFKIQKYSLEQQEAKIIKKILKVPGEHNVSNALAVLSACRLLKIPNKKTFKALEEYKGAWRRFDIKNADLCGLNGLMRITIVNDYGHHPTEVEVTLKTAREKYPKKEIWCVFQPHQYQRTYYLFSDFVRVLKQAPIDKLLITDIYSVAGRESQRIKKLVNSQKLVKAIKKDNGDRVSVGYDEEVIYSGGLKQTEKYLRQNLKSGEVVVIMGAGDIYNLNRIFRKVGKCKK